MLFGGAKGSGITMGQTLQPWLRLITANLSSIVKLNFYSKTTFLLWLMNHSFFRIRYNERFALVTVAHTVGVYRTQLPYQFQAFSSLPVCVVSFAAVVLLTQHSQRGGGENVAWRKANFDDVIRLSPAAGEGGGGTSCEISLRSALGLCSPNNILSI